MKILYMSCHEILEYDEIKLFAELGHEVFSLGAYTQPGGEENRKRPALDLPYNPHFIELALQYDRRKLHPEQLEGIDMVIIMHELGFLGPNRGSLGWDESLGEGNWPLFREFIKKGGRVVWRSIGQSTPHVERLLRPYVDEGLEIVRYSNEENTIMDNVGTDKFIPFYKDPDEFKDWNGEKQQIINFTQSLKQRGEFCGYFAIKQAMNEMPFMVYGPGNEDLGAWAGGLLTYDDQKQAMRDNRAYFYAGTYPASYTLSFIEAMMTGIPMIAVGSQLGNGQMFPDQKTYAIPNIINNGVNGFYSDDIQRLRRHARDLLNDKNLAAQIGQAGRERAIEIFGKGSVAKLWSDFFGAEGNAQKSQ